MKRLLLLTLLIPTILCGQGNSKYLANAVPQEQGKVLFQRTVDVPSLNRNQIYDIMLNWCKQQFATDNNKVVYTNIEKGDIVAMGETELVFQRTALSLDKSEMDYRFTVKADNNKCVLKVSNIRYTYNVSYQKDPEKYLAEEWITDKFALNKNKTKLNRGNGKFREKTIDFADELLNSAASALGIQTMQTLAQANSANAVINQGTADATPTPPTVKPSVSANAPKAKREGYIGFTTENIPSTILLLLPESELKVKGVTNKNIEDSNAKWIGIGNMFGKSIASVSVSKDSSSGKDMDQNSIYELCFSTKDNMESPAIIIECSKQGETPSNDNVVILGEILNIWIK